MIKRILSVSIALLTFGAASAFAQTTIERIAPEKTVLIVGSKSVKTMLDRSKQTGLWSLWQTDQFKAMRADAIKDMGEDMTKMFQELGVDEDSLVPPEGPAGIAVFPTTDKELNTPKMSFLALADYGTAESADKTNTLIQAALTRGEKDGKLEFEEKDVHGHKVTAIDLTKMQPPKENAEEDEMDFGGGMPMGDPEQMMKDFQKLFLVRTGNAFLLSSDLDSLSDSLEAMDGKGAGRVTDRKDFQTLAGKIGDTDAYAVLLTRDVMEIVAANDPMGMSMMMVPMVRAAFGKVDGYGLGLRMDGPSAMVEGKFAVSMPEGKKGFTALVDHPMARAAVPAFAGQESVSFSATAFALPDLMDVLRQIAVSNPMLQGQVGPMLDQVEPTIRQVTATLGSKIYSVSTVTRPFKADSASGVMAIECAKPQEFETVVGGLMAQGGVQGRDFLGQRIYTMSSRNMPIAVPGMPAGANAEMAIGIGGGFVFVGQPQSVEQSLRATAQPGAATLDANAQFQRAAGALPKSDLVAWGFSDTLELMEASLAAEKASALAMIEEVRKDDPEFAQELQEQHDQQSAFMKDIDFNLLREYIGPLAWHVKSTPDGFEGSYLLFGADRAKKQ